MQTQTTTISPSISPPTSPSLNRQIIFLIITFILAFTIRVALTHHFVGLASPPDAGAQPDQIDYELFAHRLATGHGYTLPDGTPSARRSPGTSLTILPVYLLTDHNYTIARLWLSFLSALTIIPIYITCARAFKPRLIAALAALLLALHPTHAYYPLHFVSEAPFILYFSLSICFTTIALTSPKPLKNKLFLHALAGIFAALAILTRGVLLFAYPFITLYLLIAIYSYIRHKQPFTPILKSALIHIFCLTLTITPWVVRNVIVLHKPTLATNVGHTLWGANNRLLIQDTINQGSWIPTSRLSTQVSPLTGNEVQTDQQALHNALNFIFSNPTFTTKLCLKKLAALTIPFYTWHNPDNKLATLAFELTWLLSLPLILLSLYPLLKNPSPYTTITLLLLFTLFITTLIFYGSPRFRDSFLPITLPLTALGLHTLLTPILSKLSPSSSQ